MSELLELALEARTMVITPPFSVKDAAMGQVGQACMASAETSRNSFSVAPLAA